MNTRSRQLRWILFSSFLFVLEQLFYPYQVSSQKFRSKLRKSLFCCFLWQWLISTTDSYGLVVVAGNNQDPGNNQDTVIVPSTNLYQEIAKNSILPVISQNQNGVEIQPLIFQLLQLFQPLALGDSVFPFSIWLMKPQANAMLSKKQGYFNYQ